MQFSYYKTINCTTPRGVVQCSVLLLAIRCDYIILRAVLVRFMWFGEHS